MVVGCLTQHIDRQESKRRQNEAAIITCLPSRKRSRSCKITCTLNGYRPTLLMTFCQDPTHFWYRYLSKTRATLSLFSRIYFPILENMRLEFILWSQRLVPEYSDVELCRKGCPTSVFVPMNKHLFCYPNADFCLLKFEDCPHVSCMIKSSLELALSHDT